MPEEDITETERLKQVGQLFTFIKGIGGPGSR